MGPKIGMPAMNEQVRFSWNIHWSCNYRCTYCLFAARWEEYAKRNVYKSPAEWEECWGRMHEHYGRCFLVINGGEPFTYPGFLDIIARISRWHWPINITTNVSVHLEEFTSRCDPAKVSLSVSFHPEHHRLDDFLNTVALLRKRGVNLGVINLVAWPPFIPDIPRYVEAFKTIGESLKLVPFIGTHEGVEYPAGYNAEQKSILGMSDHWVADKGHKGVLCQAGRLGALLLPNGNVARCGQIGDRHIIGNIFEPSFSLLSEPLPCDVPFCPCDEWKVIPDEKPPEQAGAWLP